MNAPEVLAECERRGIRLLLGSSFDVLDYEAPDGAMTAELRYLITAHKPGVVEVLFDREERAALQGCPDTVDASTWHRVINHPAAMKLQSLGLLHSIFEVRPMKKREAA